MTLFRTILFSILISVACYAHNPSAGRECLDWVTLRDALIEKDLFHLPGSDAILDHKLPILKDHGHKTKHAVVLFHGLGEWPRTLGWVAHILYSRGLNVYVPVLPWHGGQPSAVSNITLQELRDAVDRSIGIGRTLGQTVSLGGYSFGGTAGLDALVNRRNAEGKLIYPGTIRGLLLLAPVFALSGAMIKALSTSRSQGQFYVGMPGSTENSIVPAGESVFPTKAFDMIEEMIGVSEIMTTHNLGVRAHVAVTRRDNIADMEKTIEVLEHYRERGIVRGVLDIPVKRVIRHRALIHVDEIAHKKDSESRFFEAMQFRREMNAFLSAFAADLD